MNTQKTIDQLLKLTLHGMSMTFQASLSMQLQDQPSAHQLVGQMVDSEQQECDNKKIEVFLKLSKLWYNVIIEQVFYNAHRNVTRENLLTLVDCSFIGRSQNILITGATGYGKSYLACALGHRQPTWGW